MFEESSHAAPDALGILAGILVLATFTTTDFRRLRMIAVGSNIAFISYGLALGLWPVIVLHGLLLPVNAWHLAKLIVGRQRAKMPALPPATRRLPNSTRRVARTRPRAMGFRPA